MVICFQEGLQTAVIIKYGGSARCVNTNGKLLSEIEQGKSRDALNVERRNQMSIIEELLFVLKWTRDMTQYLKHQKKQESAGQILSYVAKGKQRQLEVIIGTTLN